VPIPLTIRCECGETRSADLGETVECACGRRYDTSAIPPERFAHIRAKQARVRLYLQLGVIFVVGIALLTGLLWGVRGLALGIPVSGLVWFLFFGRWYRKRWLKNVYEPTSLQLEASNK
jgi:hypothetical protein